jgi:hypothetical protein
LWAVCEPRSNTLRRKVFQQELMQSLAIADQVVLARIFNPEAIAEGERLSTSAVVQALSSQGRSAYEVEGADDIVDLISPLLRHGDVVAILSNGGFGGIYEKLPKRLLNLDQNFSACLLLPSHDPDHWFDRDTVDFYHRQRGPAIPRGDVGCIYRCDTGRSRSRVAWIR